MPVKYVIMGKRLKFLKYILDESMEAMISKVYEAQKLESKKGDFVQQIKEDLEEIDLDITENEIKKVE